MKRIGEIKPRPPRLAYQDYILAADKSRRRRRLSKRALQELYLPPFDKTVAIKVYEGGEYRDVLFAQWVDVGKSHTTIHYRRNEIEVYPVRPLRTEVKYNTTTVEYENNTSLEIIRLN